MTSDDLNVAFEKVEEISAELVLADLADLSDLTALAGIDTSFEQLHDCTEDARVREVAKACRQTVENMIFRVCKVEEGVKSLSDALTSLRRSIKYGPAEAGQSGGDSGEAIKNDDGVEINIDLDADDGIEAKAPSAPPVKQDSDGFYVDESKGAAGGTRANFAETMDLTTLDSALLGDFIAESQEHLLTANDALLRLEAAPADVDIINELFRVFHTIKGVAGFLSLGAVQALAHSTESLMDKAREKAFILSSEAVDLIFATVDALKKEIDILNAALMDSMPYHVQDGMDQLIMTVDSMLDNLMGRNAKPGRLGEELIKLGKITQDQVSKALFEQERRPSSKLGEILVEHGAVSHEDIAQVLEKQVIIGKAPPVVKESVKVDTEKLDRLIDMIGELVITEAMVTGDEELKGLRSTRLGANMRQLDKITRQLQEIGLSLRMMSLKTQFQKMARLVRDLAKKTGKEINFVSIGEDTELDKTVIEHIADPLMHMVRNSADHGMEMPEERVAAGKPRAGTVTLRAYQKGGSICVEIEDNGKGLNRDAIIKKAIEKGLIDSNSIITDNEINHLIFHPGFSTAAAVTDVSGRGVGMDVVKKNVESLRGRIEIRTKAGEGTVFTIHLPLTLAIMDGLVVNAGGERYIIPTLSVVENFRPTAKDLTEVMGVQKMVMCHGELLPLYSIAEVMGKKNTVIVENGIVMVVEDAGKRTGLLVDTIIGQQQTVIKKLGEGVGKIRGVSGGAIMPDGQVSLIIDVAETVKLSADSGSTIKDPDAREEKLAGTVA
ncbi:MAG: chemotaxis protein CheA [Chitinispirillales bacterium]|jgi:two-component system chemotaxis sensor kinase CheA|nr:chemotaxis protein CheA [Chitinispirillales bacterium]